MTVSRKVVLALVLGFSAGWTLGSGVARAADEEPVGTVVEPEDVTSAPTDEDASAKAGGGFDTPADAIQTPTEETLEPRPLTVEPNE